MRTPIPTSPPTPAPRRMSVRLLRGVISTILGFIPVIGWIIGGLISIVIGIVNLLVILILSIIDAASGKTSPLPLVGDIQIIK